MLFYSRLCQDRNLPDEERLRKKYEYFVLTRNPEISPETGKPTPSITGDYLTRRRQSPGFLRVPAVAFEFDIDGGLLFRELTRKNIPGDVGSTESTEIKRHLAIILDGLVISAPTINSEIHHATARSAATSRSKEVDSLVNILRAGALPATLKPQPVSENTMGPTLGEDTIDKGLVAIAVLGLRRRCWCSWSSTTASPAWSPASPCWPTCC